MGSLKSLAISHLMQPCAAKLFPESIKAVTALKILFLTTTLIYPFWSFSECIALIAGEVLKNDFFWVELLRGKKFSSNVKSAKILCFCKELGKISFLGENWLFIKLSIFEEMSFFW